MSDALESTPSVLRELSQHKCFILSYSSGAARLTFSWWPHLLLSTPRASSWNVWRSTETELGSVGARGSLADRLSIHHAKPRQTTSCALPTMSTLLSSARIPKGYLPPLDCSVATLLKFPVPAPAAAVCPSDLLQTDPLTFFSPDEATCSDLETIATIVLPHKDLVALLAATASDLRAQSMRSVRVLHTAGERPETLPIWIIKYWQEVATLMPIRSKFVDAETFLLKDAISRLKLHNEMPNGVPVMREAVDLLYEAGWNDVVKGFDEKSQLYEVASFASRKWLSSAHINYMLELLKIKLHRAGRVGIVMASSHLFVKIVQAYEAREGGQYKSSQNFRLPRKYGELLAMSNDDLFSIANVEATHWLPFVISPITSLVRTANSLSMKKPIHPQLREALEWWLQQHFPQHFNWKPMQITYQDNDYACGTLADNCLDHYYCGDESPLTFHSLLSIDIARARTLVQLLRQHRVSFQSRLCIRSGLLIELSLRPSNTLRLWRRLLSTDQCKVVNHKFSPPSIN